MAEFITKGCVVSGDYVKVHGDDEIFGHKDFINDVTIRGDLTVSGDTRVSQIVDFTTESGDISGNIFRGETAYFDTIIVGDLQSSDSGGSSGDSAGGLDTGPIFVVNTSPVGGVQEIVESEYSGAVIKKIKTASDQVDITILAERGDAQTYKPTISYASSGGPVSSGDRVYVTDQSHAFYGQYGIISFAGSVWLTVDYDDPPDGISESGGALRRDEEGIKWNRVEGNYNFQTIPDSDISVNSNGYSFNATVRVDSSNPVTYIFKNGMRQTSIEIEKDTAPEVIAAEFINRQGTSSFYETSSFNSTSGTVNVQQTEAKNGDDARIRVTSTKPIGQIYAFGAAISSKTVNNPSYVDNGDQTFTAEVNVNISGAGNSIQVKGFSVRVKDISGNQSESYDSDNSIITNNTTPSGFVTHSYPTGQTWINNTTDLIYFNVSAYNFDEFNISSSGVFQLQSAPSDLTGSPFAYTASNANSQTSGNFSVSLFKSSNGRSSSFSSSQIQIQSFGTIPSLNFSPNLFRSSGSAAVQTNVNVSVGENLQSLAIKSISDPNINVSSVTKNSNTSFSFQISVSDSTPRGQFSIEFEGIKLIGETFLKTDTGTVRGFSQRTVTVTATDYLAVDLGVDIFNTNKLVATATPDGGNSFSIPYDSSISGPKQDGASNLEASFGIINGSELLIDNQVITNAGNILDVNVTIEEVL